MAEMRTAIGLMSGTSMDGIDAALIVTDGERVAEFGPWITMPYITGLRERLRAVIGGRGDVGAVTEEITRAHAAVVEELIQSALINPSDIDVIGFHGHTVSHEPERGRTCQIGDGALLARLIKVAVVNDFRSADVADGGEGAPLAPLYHGALARDLERPLAVLNIGGVANVTWIGADDSLIAFDTGPGNALIDDWARAAGAGPMDRNGALAAAGSVDAARLQKLLALPYFDRAPPKSLDRDAFAKIGLEGLTAEDGAATLTAFTVQAVKRALHHLPASPRRWLVTGGGRHNPVLMQKLNKSLQVFVTPVETVDWRGDALEAEAFAFLAVRSLRGLPLSLPTTTGVARPTAGGVLHHPAPV